MSNLHPIIALALLPAAPPASSESENLAADRAANVNKAERAVQRHADRALALQQKYEGAIEAAQLYRGGA